MQSTNRADIFLPCVGCPTDSEESTTLVFLPRFEFIPINIDAASGRLSWARGGSVMFDIEGEIVLLERCASECSLISDLATDRDARYESQALASEYRQMAEHLKSFQHVRLNNE